MSSNLPDKARIIDISVVLREGMPIYPDDPEFSLRPDTSIENGDPCRVSRIEMGAHTGTHLDFPNHFIAGGKSCKDFGPERFILEALVVETAAEGNARASDLVNLEPDSGRAILFKTENSRKNLFGKNGFQKDFAAIGPDAAERLIELKALLVGIDYLSIDPYHSETHPSHAILLKNDVILLEGINLAEVEPGPYSLICFPLRLETAEASPVRAVLVQNLLK